MRCVRIPLIPLQRELTDRWSLLAAFRVRSVALRVHSAPPPHSAPDVARTHCTRCDCMRCDCTPYSVATARWGEGAHPCEHPALVPYSHLRRYALLRSCAASMPCVLMRAALGATPLLASQVRHIPDRASMRVVTAVLRSVSAHAFAPP